MQKVLIIDDDSEIRETLTSLLEIEEYDVFSCGTADEAWKAIKSHTFSTILVDIFLPDINGMDFVNQFHNEGYNTPIVIITGSAELDLARKAIRLGVFDYLVKPFKHNQLRSIIKNAVMHNNLLEDRDLLDKQKALYQEELERMVEIKISELKESESKYQSLVEQSLVGVFILQDKKFSYANRKMYDILDSDYNSLISKKNMLDFVIKKHFHVLETSLSDTLAGNMPNGSLTFQVQTEKNNTKILEMWAGSIQYQGHPAIEGIVMDVTEAHDIKARERRLELELINEHKLAAIGQLTAGIAHNLNTPISIIQGNAELLDLQYSDNDEVAKILNQTKRMTDLINTIVFKGKKEQQTLTASVDINDVLQHELEFLNADLFFKHHIEKKYKFAKNLPSVKGVYSDFSQSFLNIIQNAIDAMKDCKKAILDVETSFNEGNIIVRIRDTGCGINDDIKEEIFKPFFSKKTFPKDTENENQLAVGTGLGLSLAYHLLEPYQAKINFSSRQKEGTIFTIIIPSVPAD